MIPLKVINLYIVNFKFDANMQATIRHFLNEMPAWIVWSDSSAIKAPVVRFGMSAINNI